MKQEGSAVCQQIPLIYVEELKTDLPVILEPDKPGGSFFGAEQGRAVPESPWSTGVQAVLDLSRTEPKVER